MHYVPKLLSYEAAGDAHPSKHGCCGQIGAEGNGRGWKLPSEVF